MLTHQASESLEQAGHQRNRKNMARETTHKAKSEKRVGLHYTRFRRIAL
jgi:hypothetical protein